MGLFGNIVKSIAYNTEAGKHQAAAERERKQNSDAEIQRMRDKYVRGAAEARRDGDHWAVEQCERHIRAIDGE